MNKPKRANKICLYCHQSHSPRVKDIKKGYGKYCSRACANAHRHLKSIDKRNEISIPNGLASVGPKMSTSTLLPPDFEPIKMHCKTCSCHLYKHKRV